jgi:hypothetical protein
MLSSNMLLPNLIPLIDVTFSTPTPVYVHGAFSEGRTIHIALGFRIKTSGKQDLAIHPNDRDFNPFL